MKIRLLVVLSLIFTDLFGQNSMPCDQLQASSTCSTAPILCDIDCLDGFTARMPDTLITSGHPTLQFHPHPALLCWDPMTMTGSGTPDNMSWFAFVAGSTEIELEIVPFNCDPTSGNNNGADQGLQAGIISGCHLDDNGRIPDSLRVDCIDNPNILPFTIGGTTFVPGEVYYFFIDGYGGTICDYRVNVLKGEQPFELEDPTEILSKNDVRFDTICVGQNNIELFPDSDRLNIEYFWKISPALTTVGDTFADLGFQTSWNFDTPGEYEISFYGSNGCDQTDTLVSKVVVQSQEDEVFDTVAICFNEFPYLGPLDQDPNGDGVIGWLGPVINLPGGDIVHQVVQANNCSYNQTLHVDVIDPSPRENISLIGCGSIDYNGINIDHSIQDSFITLEGLSYQGCDSLISLTVTILELEGDIEVVDCDSSGLEIGFVSTISNIPSSYEIKYLWSDSNGPLVDNDMNDSDIIIDKLDSYSVEISVINGLDTCVFNIPPKVIDPNDNKPEITALDWTLNICDIDNIGSYKVQSDQAIKEINWTIPSGATIISGDANSESIEVDFSGTNGGTIEVSVENFCSGFSSLNFPIQIISTPLADFDLPMIYCKDTLLRLEGIHPINSDFTYEWNLPNGALLLNGDLNSNGPIEVELKNPNTYYEIEFIIANGMCTDTIRKGVTTYIDVIPLEIECETTANSISFSWNPESCADTYIVHYDGQEFNIGSQTEFTINDLPINTQASIEVEMISNCACSLPLSPASCTTLDCGDLTVDISPEEDLICEEFWSESVNIYTSINGNASNATFNWISPFVDQNGVFNPQEAKSGIHKIILEVEKDGCIYIDSTSITLFEQPELNINSYDPSCIDEIFGSISINATGGDGNFQYLMDGDIVSDQINDVAVGEHTIQLIDGNSCEVIKTVEINPAPIINHSVSGEPNIYENQVMKVILEYSMGGENVIIDSIVWYVNDEKFCVGLDCNEVNLSNLEPGDYLHNIIIYYNDCKIEEEFMVNVRANSRLHIPNAFSPNGDGFNDEFIVFTNDDLLQIDQMMIFDRWGNIMTQNSNFTLTNTVLWNGKSNNVEVGPGVYVLVLKYTDEFGQNQIVTRDVTLLR